MIPSPPAHGVLRRVAPLLLVAAALGSVAACRAPRGHLLPEPPSTSSTVVGPTTTRPDYSAIPLDPVPGQTTTSAPLAVGSTTITGSVEGPEGPVPGAVVRVDRLVGSAVQRSEVATAADGTFTAGELPGGRFRVRAFVPGALAMLDAEVFYVRDGETRELRLVVQDPTGLGVTASTTPAEPVVGGGVNLAIRVADRTVDSDGVVREVPRPDVAVQVRQSGWTALDEEDAQTTNADGVAVFQFRCDRVGSVTATAVVGEEGTAIPFDAPPCAPVPTTTTTTPDDPGTSSSTTAGP